MKKIKVLLAAILLLTSVYTFLYSQVYEASMCTGKGNSKLSANLKKGKIKELIYFNKSHIGMWTSKWCTSHLRATGKKPLPVNSPDEDPMILGQNNEALERWSCMYSPQAVMDGNPGTAWSEGKKGPGIGEIVLSKVYTGIPVYIWAGLGAGKKFYQMNNRPKTIRVYVLQAEAAQIVIGQFANGIQYKDIKVLAEKKLTLKDIYGYQRLILPPHRLREHRNIRSHHPEERADKRDVTFVAVEILSVYRGTKYNDTCISEITNKKKD